MEYPYIAAWGKNSGSRAYYIKDETDRAREDGAPEDVIYWRSTDEYERWEAMHVKEGHPPTPDEHIFRAPSGRVWYRAGGIASAMTKERIESLVNGWYEPY